jgi:hypothetical protein
LVYALEASGISHTVIRDDSRFAQQAPADSADSRKDRIDQSYRMNVHLARLYSRATQYLPAATAQVWSIEDDVSVPPDALRVLARELSRLPQAAAVSGLLRSRFQDRLIAWRGGQSLREAPVGPVEVEATGAYCLLVPRADWDRIAWRPGATLSDRYPYYDWAMCHDLRRGDRRIYVAGEVRCLHYQADGSVLTV